ncbi:MAG TPA: hypothetical protein VLA73_00875 [Burkholderiales bacterium]|nr:hypothetical protein [Burkholderiales bacterium]
MSKRATPQPNKPRTPDPKQGSRPPNPTLNNQTRKVLLKHYRAKYGVR